jgi:hypothetical protein
MAQAVRFSQAEMIEVIRRQLDELAIACADTPDASTRELLTAAILAEPPVERTVIDGLAGAAGWSLPRKAAVAVLAGPASAGPVPARRPALPADVLADWQRAEPCLVLPDPDGPGRATAIDRALHGCAAVIGPAVPLARSGWSLRCAERAAGLIRRGIISPQAAPVRCEEHLTTLLLLADEDLAKAVQAARLAPLLRLRPGQRDRLVQTLLTWLELGENATEVAQALHVHPQTVRYRLRQVRRLFGDQLQDARLRYDTLVALRTYRLLTYGES